MQANPTSVHSETKVITLGGGCFWCTEAVFARVEGVIQVVPGYANGHVSDPSYAEVCEGHTGHNEVVQITYESSRIHLQCLLDIFFAIHDPTTLNRQGHDVGTQYRSGIYYSAPEDQEVAHAVVQKVQSEWAQPVVTEVLPLHCFYEAEAYHHHYFVQHPHQAYCAYVVAPKVEKFVQMFSQQVKHDER